jgi:hypothetical protein
VAVREIAHPSIDERKARGLAARDRTPVSSHMTWRPAADRPDPVPLLEEQNRNREPDLVPVRHGRMMVCTRAATLASVAAYRETMAKFAEMRTMDIWYARLDEDELISAIRGPVTEVAGEAKGDGFVA